MANILIIIFLLIFAVITWKRFEWAIFCLFLFLPTYLLRFHLGPIPSTILEVMLLEIILIEAVKVFGNDLSRRKAVALLKNIFTKNKLFFFGVFLFLIAATISIFTAVDLRAAAGEWRAFYIEPVFLFFILLIHYNDSTTTTLRRYILLPLIISGLVTSLLAIYQHFTGWLVPYSFWENRNTYRVTGWYGFPNAVGLFLAPILPLALYVIIENIRNWKLEIRNYLKISNLKFIISLLFIPCSLLAIVFAKSTGALIGVAAGAGFLLVLYKKTRMATLALGVLGLTVILSFPAFGGVKNELLARDRSGQLRRDIWYETSELLRDRPMLGAGIASYEERILPYRQDRSIEVFHHPHNLFLTIWVNTGLAGLIGFVMILIGFFKLVIKNWKMVASSATCRRGRKSENDFKIPFTPFLLSSMIIILIMGLVDSPYIKNDLALLFWLLLAIPFITSQQKEK